MFVLSIIRLLPNVKQRQGFKIESKIIQIAHFWKLASFYRRYCCRSCTVCPVQFAISLINSSWILTILINSSLNGGIIFEFRANSTLPILVSLSFPSSSVLLKLVDSRRSTLMLFPAGEYVRSQLPRPLLTLNRLQIMGINWIRGMRFQSRYHA